jgi:ankyrin repeat protein
MRHLLTDLRGNPIFGRHRGRQPQQRRYSRPYLPTLFYLVENRQWHNVLKRCKTHPHEICLQDDANGNTPLHCACRLDPPAEVIKALLVASTVPNAEGATALHIAATNRCSAQALSVLLSQSNHNNNSSNGTGVERGPISSSSKGSPDAAATTAVSSTTVTHPTAVLTRTGRAPIHYACMSFRGLQVDAFRLLLETTLKEGMIVIENNNDDTEDIDDFFDDLDEEDDDLNEKEQQRDDDDQCVPEEQQLHAQQQAKKHIRDVEVNVMTLRDSTGQTPLGLLFRRYRERVRSVIQALEHLHKEHAKTNNPHRANLAAALRVQADLGELWEKARYMVARLTEERLQREGALLYEQEYYLGSPGDAMVAQEAAAWASEQHTSSSLWCEEPHTESATNTAATTTVAGGTAAAMLEQPRPFRIVHASVGLTGYGCPPEMIKLAISVHPHQVREMDEDGNLPLHIAAAASSFCMDTSTQQQQALGAMDVSGSSRNPLDDAWETMSMVSDTTGLLSAAGLNSTTRAFDKVIKLLLQHYPDSAKIPHGKSGRMPLVLAFKRRTWEDGIKTLLYAYPAALHQPKVIPEVYMPRILSKIGQQAFGVSDPQENLDLTNVAGHNGMPTPPVTSATSRAPPPPPSTHHHWGLYNFLTRHQQLQQQQQQQQQQQVGGNVGQRTTAALTRRRAGVTGRGAIASARSAPSSSKHTHTPRGLTILFELIKSKPDLFTSALIRRDQDSFSAPFSPSNAGEITLSFS